VKHEWKKAEKNIYMPKKNPERIFIPKFKFFSLKGEGNPNSDQFPQYIEALYALAYGVKMSYKKGDSPENYFEYTVYPLEGVWDLSEEGRKNYNEKIDKDQLVFNLMIRQPDFVTEEFAEKIKKQVMMKKKNPLIEKASFLTLEEGEVIQMMHEGSYDNELESFALMEKYTEEIGYRRICKSHREIYLSDARKVEAEKLKTVLRFKIEKR